VAMRLGVPHPTILDYLLAADDDGATVHPFLVEHSCGIRALLGPPKPLSVTGRTLETERLTGIIRQLERDGTQFIVVDLAADLGPVTTTVLDQVHDIYVVIRAAATGVQDAYRTTEALRRLGFGHKLRYVVNRARGRFDLDEVMGDLGGRVIVTVPDDPRIEAAENAHRLVALDGGGPAATAIARLAADVYPALRAGRGRRRLGLWERLRRG